MRTSEWGSLLERRFAIIGHRAKSSGSINLNDLAGSSGRFDVLARTINAALFVSHGIREDCQIAIHLMGGGPIRRVFFDGSSLKGVRPDERSIAGHFKAIMKTPVPPQGRFVDFSRGISHAGGGINQTLAEWKNEGIEPFLLDVDGNGDLEFSGSSGVGFIISDDLPFDESDLELIGDIRKYSLGDQWLQGHSCISIIHHKLDGS